MPNDPAPKPRKRQAMTASERQAKYRKAHKLSGIYLSEGTRAAINVVQKITGMTKDAVITRAVLALAAELDRKDGP